MRVVFIYESTKSFKENLEKINEEFKLCDVELLFSCDAKLEDSLKNLSNSDLDNFIDAIIQVYDAHNSDAKEKIAFSHVTQLSLDTILKILSTPKLIPLLTPESFLAFLACSEVVAHLILSIPYLREKLDAINEKENTQTLENSCAARSIMMAMLAMDLLDIKAFTRSKELEIYLEICESYGETADAAKITNFLNKQNIDVCGIQIIGSIADSTESSHMSASNGLMTKLVRSYSLFRQTTPVLFRMAEDQDDLFPDDSCALMITGKSSNNSHTVFCQKTGGIYQIVNPSGTEFGFDNLRDAMKELHGLGVFILLLPQKKLDCKNGFKC